MSQIAEYVIGNFLKLNVDDTRLIEALSTLKPDHFLIERHRQILSAVNECFVQGLNPDLPTVEQKLSVYKLEQYESWMEILYNLYKNAPSSVNFLPFVKQLKSERDARKATELLNEAHEALNDLNVTNPTDRVKNAAQVVSAIEYDDVTEKCWGDFSDVVTEIFNDMEKAAKSGGSLAGITTGFNHLDETLDGLQNGETYVLAGSPGSGKTTLAINMMYPNLLDNKNVLFYSLEMPKKQIGRKLLSCAGGFEHWVTKNDKYVKGENKTNLDKAFAQIVNTTMTIDEGFDLTAENIDLITKKHEMRMGGVDLIIVDYLTLMNAQGESETVKASNAAKACKRIAKKFDCPVLILAQLVKNIIGKPKKSDLKQTGQLEQDAAGIILLYTDPDGEDAIPKVEVDVAKNRFGETKTLFLDANFGINRMIETDRGPTIKPKENKKSEPLRMSAWGKNK